MLELQDLCVACRTCLWTRELGLGGATAAFSSAAPAGLLWVWADPSVLRLAKWSQCFPGAGPTWSNCLL